MLCFFFRSAHTLQCTIVCNGFFRSAQSDEAADAFEELTYAAQWKVVMVKIVGYQQAGEKSIPCVQIIDTNGPVVSTVFGTLFQCYHKFIS